ncbi:hypothetical protein HELRODRAFT_169634 [Helobdella robusta]|uniref:Piezo TM1-24 domain-containing protein n=1 Tax=Helobdella robusta TaxID=6412 RepID=T1F269_HELRO|nr:hypothetical protein HELRODRAFT_169634 [Helobdella robusta]ESO07928.1 hypothetical protein HELRODRAFT_169634 [Helobdella robusta]
MIFSGLALIGQMVFQIFILIYKSSDTLFYNCLPLELIFRQIGLQKINDSDLGNALRLILPDAVASMFSLFIYFICKCILQPQPSSQPSVSALVGQLQGSPSPQVRFYKSGSLLIEYLGSGIVLLLMILCGIAEPNVLNMIYFVSFLLAATLWGCGIKFGRWFIAMEVCLLVYCGFHLVAIYLHQFPSIQELWFEREGWNETVFINADNLTNSTGILYRLLGLKTFVYTNCTHPFMLNFNVNLKWTDILQVVAMSLVSPGQHPNYQSMENVTNSSYASPTNQVDDRLNLRIRRRQEQPNKIFEIFKTISLYLAEFMLSQSYNAALIVMMAWSITYHSWPTFLFLVAACLIWMVPQKRDLVLKTSPVFVFYALILLSFNYIYGLDLTSDELPSPMEGKGYSMTKIGLIRRNKHQEPFVDLAIQSFFTLVFILTLRQSRWEASKDDLDFDNLRSDFYLSRKMSGALINGILVKYWILVCSLLFLVMALQESVLYRIIYMILFLYFVITFQVSYQFWRIWVRVFWVIVIFYSMVVLISIYVVQFDEVMVRLNTMNAKSPIILEDIGLRKYSTGELFVSLLTPTSFLIVVILHIHYFQSQFLVISDVNRYSREIDKKG